MEVENHHFIVAEVRNFEALVQNEGLDPIGIYIYMKQTKRFVLIVCQPDRSL